MAFEVSSRDYNHEMKSGHVTIWDRATDRSVDVKFPMDPGPAQPGEAPGARIKETLDRLAKQALQEAIKAI